METNLCISRFSILDCTGSMHIGPWCMIGARSRIYTHDHIHDGLDPLLVQQERYGVVWQDKYIGRDVWIHENVIVLYQVTKSRTVRSSAPAPCSPAIPAPMKSGPACRPAR